MTCRCENDLSKPLKCRYCDNISHFRTRVRFMCFVININQHFTRHLPNGTRIVTRTMRLVIPVPMDGMICCPSDGCGVEDTITGIEDHLVVCPLAEVECPCTGCYERMARVDVKKHVENSVWTHMRLAVFIEKLLAFELAELQDKLDAMTGQTACNCCSVASEVGAVETSTRPSPVRRNSV
jgi:hypothetical protein